MKDKILKAIQDKLNSEESAYKDKAINEDIAIFITPNIIDLINENYVPKEWYIEAEKELADLKEGE